jgi:hypothetical protein
MPVDAHLALLRDPQAAIALDPTPPAARGVPPDALGECRVTLRRSGFRRSRAPFCETFITLRSQVHTHSCRTVI